MSAFGISSATAHAAIHPLLWRGSQLARANRPGLETGHPDLSRHLPGGGWPLGSLTELLLAQPGLGEMRLLLPALRQLPARRSIVLLHPPHAPCAQAWLAHRFPASQLLWIDPSQAADALWAAERILQHGSCGALLYWSARPPASALRRLHLAAQAGDTAFFMFRHADAARASSPSPLRLLLRPAGDHLSVTILKRRGPHHETPLLLPLAPPAPAFGSGQPSSEPRHAFVDQRLPDAAQPRRPEPALAG
ncbi:translesion DNA synthesis-associated protein ImuA [Pigmentiphaga sp. GD03639]|uniref:translesion DNA synthesis-associated protein ImuA n=1 Tax=unclassified Pigmentiphaga TaxID=2626614 RepID=UPI000B407F03|nr:MULTISPECIES: translesion DNA synthesis-associated protein ImuA [unclassified Pigmentiphaga]MDH2239572.1 translesion DNA synthesis-associated protein ImuA [Pigmentiphaga sp. GD03639]OVZ59183.1 hypothetical protein CDO46_23805 [Pigmentiphaga sp. NML030171]